MMDKTDKKIRQCIDQIKHIRKKRGLSQDALATAAGIGESTIAMMETSRNSPTLKTLLKICEALDIKFSDILKEQDQ
ncbi:MAG: helix-turn-helix transcriptional regulator [Alphaproteobacteria bacterium]|nr:helix-turn-helix transcriptional regulator [Alphaproteobacteria bacterium]